MRKKLTSQPVKSAKEGALIRRCYRCHKIFPATTKFFHRNRSKALGLAYICHPCHKAEFQKWHKANPEKIRMSRYKSVRGGGRFSLGRANAKKRGLAWELTREEHARLIMLPCFYCGGVLPEAGAGLDRLDNTRGYTLGNVAPCCWPCNRMRGAAFSAFEMRAVFLLRQAYRELTALRKGAWPCS